MNPETTGQSLTPTGTPEMQGATTFSHQVPSADPEVFVFDPVREAEIIREIIKGLEIRARDFSNRLKAYTGEIFDKGEVIANSILAIRHIEDARMRYGKCIQYANTGESVYQR